MSDNGDWRKQLTTVQQQFSALPVSVEKLRDDRQEVSTTAVHHSLTRLRRDCGARLDPIKVCTFETYKIYDDKQRETVERLREFAATIQTNCEAGNGLFLIGTPGTGKDHLAIAVARHAVLMFGASVRWLDCAAFRAAVRDSMTDNTTTEHDVFKPYLKSDILIMSDPCPPGAALTDFQAESLFRIVDLRYRMKRPTYVTANCTGEVAAAEALGSQTVDRLSHGALRLRFLWDSYRRR